MAESVTELVVRLGAAELAKIEELRGDVPAEEWAVQVLRDVAGVADLPEPDPVEPLVAVGDTALILEAVQGLTAEVRRCRLWLTAVYGETAAQTNYPSPTVEQRAIAQGTAKLSRMAAMIDNIMEGRDG